MAHSRGPINDRAAGLREAAEICDKIWQQDEGTAGAGSSAACKIAILARAATVEQATRAEAEKGGEALLTEFETWWQEQQTGLSGAHKLTAWNAYRAAALRGTKERV